MSNLLNNIDSLIQAFESDDLKKQKGAVHYLRHDVVLASLRRLSKSYLTDDAETFIKNTAEFGDVVQFIKWGVIK